MLSPEEVALAAFLHDIGKFWWPSTGKQRPDEVNAWLDFLPSEPSGRPTHLHAAYSAAFVDQSVTSDNSEIAAVIARHHDPSTREDWIVAVADRLASGERRMADSTAPVIEGGQSRITSPFDESHYLQLLHRSRCADPDATESFHPKPEAQHETGAMETAWEAFVEDVRSIGTPLTDIGTWLALLREHTTRVPAQSTTTKARYQPSISLFDHSRMCAALAHVLAVSELDEKEIQSLSQKKDSDIKPFSLVLGDLSGVQSFLYTGSTARAVRALKGRSFFLQSISERFASLAMEKLGLTPFSEVYTGGGRFMLIAPGGADLKELRTETESILLDTLGGQVGISLASADFGPTDLTDDQGGIGQVLLEAGRSLNREKRQRFRTSATQDYFRVFAPIEANQECEICGTPLMGDETQDSCKLCRHFIELGTKLRRARYLIDYVPEQTDPLSRLGQAVEPVRNLSESQVRGKLKSCRQVLEINNFSAKELADAVKSAPSGTTFITVGSRLMAVRTPEDPVDYTVVPFEELAMRSRGDTNHIAFIRADVDDLGALFHGVHTLSELATFSRSVADFFDGRITAIMEQADLSDRIYLVYSGGDDLLLAGAWDAGIEAAKKVRDEFRRYTCGRFSLSAGLEVVHPKFPLRRGADAAGIAERKAKDLRDEKDAVCIMGIPMPWEDLKKVEELVDMVVAEIDEGRPRQLIRRLREIWWAYTRGKEELVAEGLSNHSLEEAARWNRWRWLLVYGLRHDAGRRAKEIQAGLLDEKIEEYLGLIARWAELATRR